MIIYASILLCEIFKIILKYKHFLFANVHLTYENVSGVTIT